MASYPDHRRLARLVAEMAEELAAESRRFHHAARARRTSPKLESAVEESTWMLQHAIRSMILAIVRLREAGGGPSAPIR